MTLSANTNKPTKEDVREARSEAGLTQQQAAFLIGYSTRAWQEWEAGRNPMRRATFRHFKFLARKRKEDFR